VTALALAFRWLHLLVSLALVGAALAPLLAGRSHRPTAQAWEARVLEFARLFAAAAIVSGLGLFAIQTIALEGRTAALADPTVLGRVLLDTRTGLVLGVRLTILLLMLLFLGLRLRIVTKTDWISARGESVLLASAALLLISTASHAAAIEPDTLRAIVADAVHLGAAGIWLGGLAPLALLLLAAAEVRGADARPYAVLALRRFSNVALGCVIVLFASGAMATLTHVGGIAPLVGTTYGRLLLLKLLFIVPVLAFGAVNRRRWLPALSGDADTAARPAMRRLATSMRIELAIAATIVLIVAGLTATPPARHLDPAWPFDFRLSWDAITAAPAARMRVLVASQIAVLGAVAAVAGAVVARARGPLLAGGTALLVLGAGLGLPPLAVDAYPTTYRRPSTAYTATSVAAGHALYREHCASCHGVSGGGDGPAARGLPRPPADLRARHTADHTAGDLFWWLTHGIPKGGMPAFGDRLSEEQRWDLVNLVRAIGASVAANQLAPTVRPDGPWIVAPDFTFAVGPAPQQSLRDFRERSLVVLVFYTLPASRPRLGELAAAHRLLTLLGAEVVAVPTDAAPDAIARLGPTPPILFPVVTTGAEEILAGYRLFAPGPHTELIVDRQGYLRARWTPEGPPTRATNLLLAEIQQLNEEKPSAPPAGDHVH
jgi:putative copper resistance protein D